MEEYQVNTSNNLIISIDWLSFTIHTNNPSEMEIDDIVRDVDNILESIGLKAKCFRDCPNGANGYKRMKKYENISVLYDGAPNMGIHVNVSGSSVGTLLEAYREFITEDTPFGMAYTDFDETILSSFFNRLFDMGASITRLDLAIDDFGAQYYELDDIKRKQEKGKIISKWKTWHEISPKTTSSNDKIGQTLYFGSPQSEIQLRIYDKQLERNKVLEPGNENYIYTPWVRWELEFHKDRANEVSRMLSDGSALGSVAVGVLAHYFRIIVFDDCNKSRCSSERKWQKFIDNVKSLKITVHKTERTLEQEVKMFEKQQGRKVAKMALALGEDYLASLAMRYECRLTPRDLEQLGLV